MHTRKGEEITDAHPRPGKFVIQYMAGALALLCFCVPGMIFFASAAYASGGNGRHIAQIALVITPTGTSTPSPTVTNTPSPTVTSTPSPTVTSTPSPTATNTPSPTVTKTPSPTVTRTPAPTATKTPAPGATVNASPSPGTTATA